MTTLTDTLWNHFNKRWEWILRDADTIRAQDRAIASGTALAPSGLSQSPLSQAKPPAAIAREKP